MVFPVEGVCLCQEFSRKARDCRLLISLWSHVHPEPIIVLGNGVLWWLVSSVSSHRHWGRWSGSSFTHCLSLLLCSSSLPPYITRIQKVENCSRRARHANGSVGGQKDIEVNLNWEWAVTGSSPESYKVLRRLQRGHSINGLTHLPTPCTKPTG